MIIPEIEKYENKYLLVVAVKRHVLYYRRQASVLIKDFFAKKILSILKNAKRYEITCILLAFYLGTYSSMVKLPTYLLNSILDILGSSKIAKCRQMFLI